MDDGPIATMFIRIYCRLGKIIITLDVTFCFPELFYI